MVPVVTKEGGEKTRQSNKEQSEISISEAW